MSKKIIAIISLLTLLLSCSVSAQQAPLPVASPADAEIIEIPAEADEETIPVTTEGDAEEITDTQAEETEEIFETTDSEAEESIETSEPESEEVSSTPNSPADETLSSASENLTLSFSEFPDAVKVGETLQVTVTLDTNQAGQYRAFWMFNKSPIASFSNDAFSASPGKTSTLRWNITEEWNDWGTVEVGFMLCKGDSVIAEIYRSFEILPLSVPVSTDNYIDFSVLSRVHPVEVEATIIKNTSLYEYINLTHSLGTIPEGTNCYVLSSKSGSANRILLPDGRRGWVSINAISVADKIYLQEEDVSKQDKDSFVAAKGYESETDYLIWVHLACQKVNVFLRKDGRWCIEKIFRCASGKNKTPTINGTFTYSAYQNAWYFSEYYVKPVMIFSGNYALHSVPMKYDGTFYDDTMGFPASHGCVRLLPEDMQWLADYVPIGTTVVVF